MQYMSSTTFNTIHPIFAVHEYNNKFNSIQFIQLVKNTSLLHNKVTKFIKSCNLSYTFRSNLSAKACPALFARTPQCSYAGSLETPEHVLLHCDNFLAERLAMKTWLESIGLQLTLPILLGVVPGSHQKMAKTILSQTSQFICQIQKRRHF